MPWKSSEKSKLYTVTIPNGISELVEKYCEETGVSLSGFVKESVIRRLEYLSLISSKLKNGG